MSNYRNILESYLKTQEIWADTVIDVGGRSNPIRDRVKDWQVSNYIIYDNGLEPGEPYKILDLNNKESVLEDEGDYVFCLEVFEYIHNPHQAIINLNYLTKPGGILYITFPFLYPVHEPKESDYLRYTADGASKLLGINGFKILEIVSRDMTPAGFEAYKAYMKAEGFHASKHSRHDQLGFIIKAQKQ